MDRTYSSSSESGYIKPRSTASKNPAVSALQDLLFYQLTGIGYYQNKISKLGKTDITTNNRITRLLYLTNKNINFRITTMINAVNEANMLKSRLENILKLYNDKSVTPASALFKPAENLSQMVSQANIINAQKNIKISNIYIYSMQELIRQSLCASANYYERIKTDNNIPSNILNLFYELLNFQNNENITLKKCKSYALKAGELHSQILELLLASYEKRYGVIERKKVSTDFKKGASILVAGEDFQFLKNLLEETQDKEINIYTYGIMNYAHVFSQLNKFNNLVGIYLGKYGDMSADIEKFPGIVVLTTGNLDDISDIYRGRVFSTEEISMLGITRIDDNNIKTLINAAYDAPGFVQDESHKSLEIGFSLKELERYADKIYNLINSNTIKNILIFLGCNYFTEEKDYMKKLIKILPKDVALVTLNCYCHTVNTKLNQQIVLNLGEYVNLFSFIRLLFAIAGKFKKDVNEIPINITINLKNTDSIASLLMLLAIGIKNIKINSDLPNYQTESLLECFSSEYNLSKISNAKLDANNIIEKRA